LVTEKKLRCALAAFRDQIGFVSADFRDVVFRRNLRLRDKTSNLLPTRDWNHDCRLALTPFMRINFIAFTVHNKYKYLKARKLIAKTESKNTWQ